MKKNITYVDAAKFETILKESGATFLAQKGFIRVDFAKGRRIYVAATKRVGRIDLSGFTAPEGGMPGISELGELSFGAVHHQLDFSQPEDAILDAFRRVLAHYATLPAIEKVERKPSANPKAPVAQGWSQDIPKAPSAEELKAQRMEKLKIAAAKKKAAKAAKAPASSPEAEAAQPAAQ